MKWVVVTLAVVALIASIEAKTGGRGRGHGHGHGHHNRDRTWTWTECQPQDPENRCHGGLKNGTCAGTDCRVPTYTNRKCRPDGCPPRRAGRCKYAVNKTAGIPECDQTTNTRVVTMYLKRGDPATCITTKQQTLPCGHGHGRGGGGRGRGRGGRNGRRRNTRDTALAQADKGRRGCKYTKGEWKACGDDGMKSRTMTLRPESRGSCEQQKEQKKMCSKADRKAKKQAKKQRRKEKKQQRKEAKVARKENVDGRQVIKNARREERKQRKQDRLTARQNGCKYTKSDWGACNAVTNMQTKTVHLRKGESAQCQASRNFTRTCKDNCKYVKSNWGDCKNGTRKRVLTLESGDTSCAATLHKTRPCINAKGKEQCFYTPWSVWGPCQNNVQTKTRTMTSGGHRCDKHKKTVKTRGCEA